MLGSLVPWRARPLLPMSGRFPTMMGDMEDLMEKFFGSDGGRLTSMPSFVPTIDVVEDEKQFDVTVDLPGLKPEEVNVELKDGDLWISGKREEEKEEKGKTYHRIERSHGEFSRVLPLPSSIDETKIDAKFENGVLKITVPKTEEAKTQHIVART